MRFQLILAITIVFAAAAFAIVLEPHRALAQAVALTSEPFGKTAAGMAVTRYTMKTRGGVAVSFINYGGAITDVVTPDRRGRPGHIVLGFPTLRQYETIGAQNELYFGALLGRYANWIDRGRFTLDGHGYQLSLSDPPNTIHGGATGFDKRFWQVKPIQLSGSRAAALLTYVSPEGEEGYPGTVKVTVTYTLAEDGAFTIRYQATTDRPTILNLSNHMNFNLAGAGSDNVLGQTLTIDADRYLPLNRSQLPLGSTAEVAGTPLDFRAPIAIGARIHTINEQLSIAQGYDNYWVLNKRTPSAGAQFAARAYDPGSGRTIDCFTTEPGVQIYTGGFFDGATAGIGGRYPRYAGFTLETQHYPDSPNHPEYPSTTVRPDQIYESITTFRFSAEP